MTPTIETAETPAYEVKRPRSPRNLLLRTVSALVALVLVYCCLRWDVINASGWAWAVLTAAMSLMCLREFYRLAAACGIQPFPALGFVMGPLWLLATEWELSGGSGRWFGFGATLPVLVLAMVAAMLLQLTRRSNDHALANVSITVFGIFYCSGLLGLTLHLRHLELRPGGWPMEGVEFVVVCIFVSKVSDVGALLTGRRWGRHKLIPRISPGKTWEGALGGLAFSVLLLQFMIWTAPFMALARFEFWKLLLLSFLLAAGGLAGDLIESVFKRNSQRKDAGAGIPGFGGTLDLMDSIMLAAPVMYFFLLICGAGYVQ